MFKDVIYSEDVEILNGDLKVEFSEDQHVEHILRAGKGNFYQYPEIGVNITELVNGNTYASEIRQAIKSNLESDNFRVDTLKVTFINSILDINVKAVKLK